MLTKDQTILVYSHVGFRLEYVNVQKTSKSIFNILLQLFDANWYEITDRFDNYYFRIGNSEEDIFKLNVELSGQTENLQRSKTISWCVPS